MDLATEAFKRCGHCGKDKVLRDFPVRGAKCEACVADYTLSYRAANKMRHGTCVHRKVTS